MARRTGKCSRQTAAVAFMVIAFGVAFGGTLLAIGWLKSVSEIDVRGISLPDVREIWSRDHWIWDKWIVDMQVGAERVENIRARLVAYGFLEVEYDQQTGSLIATAWICKSLAGCRSGFLEWLPTEISKRRKQVYGDKEADSHGNVEQLDSHWWIRVD